MTSHELASTATLIHRIQNGETTAREELVERCLPLLRRWAHGRLPRYGRELAETDDLVQDTFLRALDRIEVFRPERQGAFLAYLRQALINAVRSEVRSASRRPMRESFDEKGSLGGRDPGERFAELDAYERALAGLGEKQRQAVVLRFEFGMTFPEVATELESSPDAVRMLVSRALLEMAKELGG